MAPSEQELDFFRTFGCNVDPDTTQTTQATMPVAAPMRRRATTIALTAAAVDFIARHTAADPNVLHDEECPICLESYVTEALEPCLRIKGIAGCTCRIGQVCLGKMLSKSPLEEKKCPLCRAVWIASTTPRLQTARQLIRLLQRTTNLSVGGMTTSVPHPPRLSAIANPFIPGRPVPIHVIDSDPGDDFRKKHNTDLNREIDDVRARARGTQPSRSQHKSEIPSGREHLALSSNRFSRSRNSLSTASSPARVQQPARATQSIPAGHSQPTITARRGLDCHMTIRPPSSPNNARATTTSARFGRNATRLLTSPSAALPPSTISVDNKGTKLLDHYENTFHTLEASLGTHNSKLTKRKADLDSREAELSKRAKILDEREAIVARKEKDIAAKGERASAMAKEHRVEMQVLLNRQKEEMERI